MEVFRGKVLECLQLTPKWFSQCMCVCIYGLMYACIPIDLSVPTILHYNSSNLLVITTEKETF